MRWIDYREALGIGFSDSDKAEMLKNKIIVLYDELDDIENVSIRDEKSVCR